MRIVKIYDDACDVCQKMSKYERDVIASTKPAPELQYKRLDTILNPDNEDPDDCLVAHYAERYACNPDYTIDLPVYMALEGKRYISCLIGEKTPDDLRKELQAIIDDEQNPESGDRPS